MPGDPICARDPETETYSRRSSLAWNVQFPIPNLQSGKCNQVNLPVQKQGPGKTENENIQLFEINIIAYKFDIF